MRSFIAVGSKIRPSFGFNYCLKAPRHTSNKLSTVLECHLMVPYEVSCPPKGILILGSGEYGGHSRTFNKGRYVDSFGSYCNSNVFQLHAECLTTTTVAFPGAAVNNSRTLPAVLSAQDNAAMAFDSDDAGMDMEMDMDSEPCDEARLILPSGTLRLDDGNNVFDDAETEGEVDDTERSNELFLVDDEYLREEVEHTEIESTTAGVFSDPIYWFIAIFLVHFQLRLLSEAAAELLMKFINAIIEAFAARISQATGAATESLFRLQTKLSTLRKYAGYGTVASNIIRYVVCPTCHKTFEMDELRLDPVVDAVDEILCDHKNFPLRNLSTCGQRLFKGSSGNRAVPIKVLWRSRSTITTHWMASDVLEPGKVYQVIAFGFGVF
ncbi:hypothetical protein VTP01DRAFT_7249 [Rhizomucor pusillus]|uniref:uncharacterized protein n=1 Tax=Rhizomucor pusillus TaxID=4840 RepID=UPI003743B8B5